MENYKESLVNIINVADCNWEMSIKNCLGTSNLIFSYKNAKATMFPEDMKCCCVSNDEIRSIEPIPEELYQIIVAKNIESKSYGKQRYTVSVVTSRKAYTLNYLPATYLTTELIEDLREYKVSEKIIANFEQIIKDIEE